MQSFGDQRDYAVRFEWGERGLHALAEASAFVIVDVLSFSTCVAVGVERGAAILPYRSNDDRAPAYARDQRAMLAGRRSDPASEYSLSPESLLRIDVGARLVLPSPNGSALSFEAAERGAVIAGCLRNRAAVAAFLERHEGPVAVIAAGERWPDGSLRPAFEDLIGAGGIIDGLRGPRSPEADGALAAYAAVAHRIADAVMNCASGRELAERGYVRDVEIAAAVDASTCVPILKGTAFAPAELQESV